MRKVLSIALIGIICFTSATYGQSKSQKMLPDLNKSSIQWKTKRGDQEYSGSMKLKDGGYLIIQDQKPTQMAFFADVSSIKCEKCGDQEESQKLLQFLLSSKFFDANNIDFASFKMMKIKDLEDSKNGNYMIEGQLTIKGYSNKVNFPISLEFKNDKVFASALIPLNRTLWNLKEPLNDEGQMIYNMEGMVYLEINLEANPDH